MRELQNHIQEMKQLYSEDIKQLQNHIQLIKQLYNQEMKRTQKYHIHEMQQLRVSSLFLAFLIQSTLLYFLTGTFIRKSIIISL
jgi:hypothetical protein